MHETLMTSEEAFRSEDLGGYFRIAPDDRDLNYSLYVDQGVNGSNQQGAYTSDSTEQLNVDQTVEKLQTVQEIAIELQS
jgi:UDP-glucose 4-epimerase